MEIVHFPHPTLRHKSKTLRRVDQSLRKLIEQMFELMYREKGVGLAANQVDLPFQMFVVNVAGEPDEGEELVFINPVLSRPKGSEEAEEGCLSLPGVYGNVTRPREIRVKAYNLQGKPVDETFDGLLARIIQHEYDHLQGTMFVDRMTESGQKALEESLEEFQVEFASKRDSGAIPDDATIQQRIAELEKEYC